MNWLFNCDPQMRCPTATEMLMSTPPGPVINMTEDPRYKRTSLIYGRQNFILVHIDSLHGITFRNQLMSIMLVISGGQHLHA